MSKFYEIITAAIKDISEHGYDSQTRIDDWVRRINMAISETLPPDDVIRQILTAKLNSVYHSLVDNRAILKRHEGISRFTIERIKPQLRAELDRRIMASANLIKLNREQMIARTLQRFSGWATSIPAGGSSLVPKGEVRVDIRKALASLPFTERRVSIDQGHKLAASLNEILAKDGGAIAAEWRSNWRQPNYDYDPEHKALDKHVFAVRGNWAQEKGLMKPGPDGYTDDVIGVGQRPYCRCWYRYLYSLRALPEDMLTQRGRLALERVA